MHRGGDDEQLALCPTPAAPSRVSSVSLEKHPLAVRPAPLALLVSAWRLCNAHQMYGSGLVALVSLRTEGVGGRRFVTSCMWSAVAIQAR